MLILGIDPGKTTGAAALDTVAGDMRAWEEDGDCFLDDAHDMVRNYDAVVCEDFAVGPRTLRCAVGRMWSLEAIGHLRVVCRRSDTPFILQRPSQVKPLVTDNILKGMGMWKSTDGGHQMDALRHAVYFAAKIGEISL